MEAELKECWSVRNCRHLQHFCGYQHLCCESSELLKDLLPTDAQPETWQTVTAYPVACYQAVYAHAQARALMSILIAQFVNLLLQRVTTGYHVIL